MSLWTHLTLGPLRWQVQPAWRELLLDADGLRLEEWRTSEVLQVIKQAAHRTVYRIGLPKAPIYIKHYPVADLRALVRQRLRPTKARTELTRALALTARQIPTIEPLGIAEHPSGESYLITRALEGTLRLDEFVQGVLGGAGECEAARGRAGLHIALPRRLAQFLARLHEAGVRHQDLHAGNLLIRPETLELFLIDLHDVRLSAPLGWRASRDNLVLLNRWLRRRSSRSQRLRFWHAYVQARHGWKLTHDEKRRRASTFEQATLDSCLRLWRHRRKRPVRPGPHFYHLRTRSADAWAVRDLPRSVLQGLLQAPEEPVRPGKLLKSGRSSTIVETELPGVGAVILKRFNVVDWTDTWRGWLRESPALRSWLNGHQLLDCGLPTPRPLAFIQRRRFGLLREGYLVWEKVKESTDLHTLALRLANAHAIQSQREKRTLAERLGWLIRCLHDRQLSHRDLKASNILVERRFEGQAPVSEPRIELRLLHRPRMHLIDLVGVEAWRSLPRRVKLQNLARLNVSFALHPTVSRTDRLRFLRAYMGWGVWGKAGWKDRWRAIAAATLRKIARNERRGRPIG